jgi:preprotein translocase subunit YajC
MHKIPKLFLLVFAALIVTASVVFADAPAVPAGTAVAPAAEGAASAIGGQPGIMGMLMPFALMFGVLYFLMIRPQQKKMKEQQSMLSALSHGDEVVTTSGMLGKITGITDKVVTLEVADNVRVKMLKSQVSQVVKGPIKELTQ